MKKKAIASILLSAVLLGCVLFAVGCGETTPIENVGQSTVLEVKKAPSDYSAKEVVYGLAYKLGTYATYRIDTKGETVAHKGFITYTQTTNTFEIKNGDEAFTEVVSDSAIVHTKHQIFAKDGKAVYRNDTQGELSVSTLAAYKEVYGVAPGENNVGSYVFNKDSIVFAERVESESKDGNNVYRYMLNTKAMGPLRMQMKQFGGLADYPLYSDENPVEVTLTVKDDWTPVSVVSKQAYKISVAVLGEMDCTQSLTSTFSAVGGTVSVPGADEFNAKIGSTPTVVKPVETPDSDPALEGLVASLIEKDLSGGVRVVGSASAEVKGINVSIPVDLGLQFDLDEYTASGLNNALKVSFRTKLIGTEFAVHYTDNKIYVKAGANKNVFDIPTAGDGSVDPSAFDKLGSILAVDKAAGGYTVAVKKEAMVLINLALAEYGVTLDTLALYVPTAGDSACGIILNVAGADFAFALDTVIADYPFSLPSDFDDYVYGFGEWETGKHYELTIRTEATADAFGYPADLPIDIMIKLDSKALFAGDIAGAVNAKITVKLMEAAQSGDTPLGAFVKLAAMFIPDLDPEIAEILAGDATTLNIYYVGDGNIYIEGVVTHDGSGDPIDEPYTDFIKTYALGDLISGLAGGNTPAAAADETADSDATTVDDINKLIGLIGQLISGVTVDESGFSVTLPQSVVKVLSDKFAELMDTAAAKIDEMIPGMAAALLGGFMGEINDVTFDCSFAEDGGFSSASLVVKLLPDGKTESVALLAIKFSDKGLLDGELDGNADYIKDMIEKLKPEEGGEELAA